jgi:glycosyltransferase involved in cell wall biosynthesis
MGKISVLSPAHNHGKHIDEAIRSVLLQTTADFELVISDDASTDDTIAQIKKFSDPRILLLTNEENAGPSINSRRCFARSSGKYIAWFSPDDVYEPNTLELLSSYLDAHPEVVGVFGGARLIDESDIFTGEQWKDYGVGMDRFRLLKSLFYCESVLCPPAGMIRREALESINYRTPSIRQVSDVELWIKLLFTGDLTILPENILRFRTRSDQRNSSALTEANVAQFTLEMSETLELFSQYVTDFSTLSKIFPEILERGWKADDRFVPFYLARLALEFENPAYCLFGLRILYQIFSSESLAQAHKEYLDFGYPEFFTLTGAVRVFYDHDLRAERDELNLNFEEQSETLERISKQNAVLANRFEELKQTCNRYTSEIQLLQTTISERDQQMGEMSTLIADLMARCRQLEQTCDNYTSSSSWRLTAPIRQFKQSVLEIYKR